MKQIIMLLSVVVLYATADSALYAQLQYVTDTVVVSANRTSTPYSEVGRSFEILNNSKLKLLPASNATDVLQFVNGVDMQQRGTHGVQSDISIRGSGFEQALVLVDGISMNDPQTGHHTMNLPIPVNAIERIEVIKGPGSKIYGPNAFSGVINVITKRATKPGLNLSLNGGEYGYYEGALTAALPYGASSTLISLQRSKSDGYRTGADFDMYTGSIKTGITTPIATFNATAGYNSKQFGANGFYSLRFPTQFEKTNTLFVTAGADFTAGPVVLSPKVYWRRHNDDFVLRRENPAFYQNIHTTHVYGGTLQGSFENGLGTAAFGAEAGKEEIISTNLKNHQRTKAGFSVEQKMRPIEKLIVVVATSVYNYDTFGWNVAPGIDAAYLLSPSTRVFGSFGSSFRAPSFTELYYTSTVEEGNVDLKPEEAYSYEAGAEFLSPAFSLRGSVFYRDARNVIDWVKTSASQPKATATNITDVSTVGTELGIVYTPGIFNESLRFEVNYTWLDIEKSAVVYESRYVLNNLKHQLIGKLFHTVPYVPNATLGWVGRFEQRVTTGEHFIADLRVNYTLGAVGFSLQANNLFNKSYNDFNGLPLPGRWITAGLSLGIGG